MLSEPAIPKKYSLTWAGQVVEQLREAHPRATDYVMKLYGITTTDLARFLARGDPVYTYLKKRIKYISNWEERDDGDPRDIQVLSPERSFIAKFAPESVRGRLDNRFLMSNALGAGSEGLVCDQSEAEGADLPSGLFQFFLFPDEMGALGEVCEVRGI